MKALTRYACVSERLLREWIHRPNDPLPASRVGKKIMIRKSTFDQWMESHRVQSTDVHGIVDEILAGVKS